MNVMYEVQYLTPNNEWRQFGSRHYLYRAARAEFDAIKEKGTLKGVRILEIEEDYEIINEWSRE